MSAFVLGLVRLVALLALLYVVLRVTWDVSEWVVERGRDLYYWLRYGTTRRL